MKLRKSGLLAVFVDLIRSRTSTFTYIDISASVRSVNVVGPPVNNEDFLMVLLLIYIIHSRSDCRLEVDLTVQVK